MAQTPANLYGVAVGTASTANLIPIVLAAAPGANYTVGPFGPLQLGQNVVVPSAGTTYVLAALSSQGGVVTATWNQTSSTGGGGSAITSIVTDSGGGSPVTPSAGVVNILGTANQVAITGSSSTAHIALPNSITTPGSLTTTTSLASGTTLTAGTGLTVTSGGAGITGTTNINTTGAAVSSIGTGGTGAVHIGNATGNTAVTGSLTASTGLVATTGGLTVSAGGASIVGTTAINISGDANTTIGNPSGAGQIRVDTPVSGLAINGNGHTIAIGNDADNTIFIGSNTGASPVLIKGGSSGVVVQPGSGGVQIQGNGNAIAIGIDSNANLVTIGSTNASAATVIRSGSGITFTGSQISSVTVPGAYPYNILNSDFIIAVDSSAAHQVNLPATPLTGQRFVVIDHTGTANANNITISGNGNNIVIAAGVPGATNAIAQNWGVRSLTFTGTLWQVI